MNDGIVQPTLRQLRQQFRDPVTLAALAGVALVLGVSGPFDTFAALGLAARLAYWSAVVPLTYAAGALGAALAHRALTSTPPWARVPLVSLASSLLVAGVLLVLNGALGFVTFQFAPLARDFAAVYLICLAVVALGTFIALRRPSPVAPPVATAEPATPAILDRLPFDKRGDLVSLTVQDHYVAVTTTRGRTLLLMRLGDAVALCAPVAGLQTHRSHWVALSQVAHARRSGDAAILTLQSGVEIPISRSRLRAAQTAGLLPTRD